jgi:hypothetical protein
MLAAQRWETNWRVLSPPGGVRVDVPRWRRRGAERTLRALAPGTPVVLCAAGPGALARTRRFAARAGVHVDTGYLALPSAAAPGYIVEERPAAVDVFFRTILVTPPGTRFARAVAAALALLRAVGPWPVVRALAPGRLVVGRRA